MARSDRPESGAFVVTGPTSGIGLRAAIELAEYGTVILVGRNRAKLEAVRERVAGEGGRAVAVPGDVSDIRSIRGAAAEINALDLPIRGVLNNAGVMFPAPGTTAQGWDITFATNHLGPFAFTEALAPRLEDGSRVVFVVSAIEDPMRKPARIMGMRGGRYLSAQASAIGEWAPDGSRPAGIDAYATSKQCSLAAAFALAREMPRLHISAFEPGINPSTGLGGGNALMRFVFGQLITRLPPFRQYRSTPEQATRVAIDILTDPAAPGGVYYDERGRPMRGSELAHDPAFQDRVVAETRALLAGVPA
ncbi:SDR family NAD(P)-dependent oxidoreductase [Burkholderia gladioli]|uniref:SDR family NAD(P)-dependent oxidoreductase n=1 Tax=Burkholderia gladioli TaxID=28095 RepID=UPI001C2687CC|nr:SDR family NAD(P)-dependent oxidoreductase [Burkholderia gladioli]MBU9378654.1 SDR family NAD(P)-dependent oxidoreductase [Burkholderia gladioli]